MPTTGPGVARVRATLATTTPRQTPGVRLTQARAQASTTVAEAASADQTRL